MSTVGVIYVGTHKLNQELPMRYFNKELMNRIFLET